MPNTRMVGMFMSQMLKELRRESVDHRQCKNGSAHNIDESWRHGDS